MSRDNYQAVMAEIYKHEGGYVDHPKDPGGATNMGITFNVLKAWRGKPITKDDVKKLTKAEAGLIYEANYWNKIKGDSLPIGVDLAVMDPAVNSGVSRGAKWLQAALGVKQDGEIGPATLKALEGKHPDVIINTICDVRMGFLRGLKTWPTFGKGWTSRVESVRKKALAMAKTAPPVKSEPVKPVTVNVPNGTNTITAAPAKVDHGTTAVASAGVLGAAFVAFSKAMGWW